MPAWQKVSSPSRSWTLQNTEDALDRWIALDDPPQDLRIHVLTWMLSRVDNPYRGLRRTPGFTNVWFGPVPETLDETASTVLTVTLLIDEPTRVVRFDGIVMLSWPL